MRHLQDYDDFLMAYDKKFLWFPVEAILWESWKNVPINAFLAGSYLKYEFAYNIPLNHQQISPLVPVPWEK